jgi:hypothetical protein
MPILYGYNGQSGAVQLLTSLELPPMHDKQNNRMAAFLEPFAADAAITGYFSLSSCINFSILPLNLTEFFFVFYFCRRFKFNTFAVSCIFRSFCLAK